MEVAAPIAKKKQRYQENGSAHHNNKNKTSKGLCFATRALAGCMQA